MPAEQSLRDGDLDKALAELQDEVRKSPSNAKHRVFLFQLLSVLGQWDRALTQLNLAGELDASTLAMVQMYREALRCEALRAEVFAGERSPMVFGEPEQWMALLVEALRLGAQGQGEKAKAMREEALAAAPTTAGAVDGKPFEWIADADSRIGPMLEAVINGRYYWVPFQRLSLVGLEEPEDLRDLVWAPAQFTFANGGQVVGLIPTRYAGSEKAADGLLRLARKTEWADQGHETFAGLGQRVLSTDSEEHALLSIRKLALEAGAAGAPPHA
jgi:type VI secretion system protein ImpE